MNTAGQVRPAAIPAAIANIYDWEATAHRISVESGEPTVLTAETVEAMIGSAVPLLFAADAAKNMDLLRGTFADSVIAQCHRYTGCLLGATPTTVVLDLVGVQIVSWRAVLRAHLSIEIDATDGSQRILRQFWDLQIGAQATVGQATCPNCGAPITTGALICGHCCTDVRKTVSVPLLVSRLASY